MLLPQGGLQLEVHVEAIQIFELFFVTNGRDVLQKLAIPIHVLGIWYIGTVSEPVGSLWMVRYLVHVHVQLAVQVAPDGSPTHL